MRTLTGAQAIQEATDQALAHSSDVVVYGLGVSDPKGVFGTTLGLQKKYGPDRVFDTPVSEDAITGLGIGAALYGVRPIVCHQRLDFALLSLDTLVNNAAKWHYMFDGQYRVPMVVRMIVGRGWGQGPQHSQSLQALFAHIPGLKVVMPTTPHDSKGLLLAAVQDNNPVIYIEHRWLHSLTGVVPEAPYAVPIGKARIACEGSDVTVVAASFMVLEALRAAEVLRDQGVQAEVIDLRSISPWDRALVEESVRKTGRLVVADTGHRSFGVSAEIVAHVSETCFGSLRAEPRRVCSPDLPCPTTAGLTQYYYPRSCEVAQAILTTLGGSVGVEARASQRDALARLRSLESGVPSDVPDLNFTGPF